MTDIATTSDHAVDRELAESYLATAIAAIANGGGPGATAVKATSFRQLLMAGRLHFAAGSMPKDALLRYPKSVNSTERSMVESLLRASFASFLAAEDNAVAERAAWAKRFWGTNWNLFPCRIRGATSHSIDVPIVAGDAADPTATGAAVEVKVPGERISALWIRFLEDALQRDPGLYDPGRQEMISGLTAHGLRTTLALAANPGLWVGEFSAPLLRSVVEILIVLAWLGTPEGRAPEVHERFKDFGRGRLKLAKLHAEEFADSVATSALLEEVLEGLNDEVNREVGEEFQDISLEATFAGRDLRKMAIAAGAEWSYKLELAPMSSVLHSEWPMVTRYAMDLCVTPLHKFHWLPRTTLTPAVRPVAGETAVLMAQRLLDAYLALVTPSDTPDAPAGETSD